MRLGLGLKNLRQFKAGISSPYTLNLPFSAASPTYLSGATTTSAVSSLPGYVDTRSGTVQDLLTGGTYSASFAANTPVIIPNVGLSSRAAVNNLFTATQTFDNATYWGTTNATITSNVAATTAPDGSNTADKLIPSVANTYHTTSQQVAVTALTQYTFSVMIKPAGYNFICLDMGHPGTADWFIYYNLSTVAVGTAAAGVTGTITALANGWYLITATKTTIAGQTQLNGGIFAANADPGTATLPQFAGDGTSGYYLWQGQIVQGLAVTRQAVGITAAASAGADNETNTLPAPTDQNQLFYAIFTVPSVTDAANRFVANFNDGTAANSLRMYLQTTGALSAAVDAASSNVYSASLGTVAANTPYAIVVYRTGGTWRAGYIVAGTLTWFGAAVSGAFPAGLTSVNHGHSLGSNQLNGFAKSIVLKVATFATDASIVTEVGI